MALEVGVCAGEGAPECGLPQGGEAFCAEVDVMGLWASGGVCCASLGVSLELDAFGGGCAEVGFCVRGLWLVVSKRDMAEGEE